MFEVRF